MDVLLDPVRYPELYNCSAYPVEAVPIESRRKLTNGIIIMALSVIFELSHLLCLFAMWKFVHLSAYKILFLNILSEFCGLLINGFLYGFFLIQGWVFCSTPLLQYVAGMIYDFCWAHSSTLQVFLAFERCLAQLWPDLTKKLFDGPLLWAWFLLILLCSVYYGFFTMPILLNSAVGALQFDPFARYRTEQDDGGKIYWKKLDFLYCCVIAITLPLVYILFGISLAIKWSKMESQPNEQQQRMKRSIFIQVFAVSLLQFSSLVLYFIFGFLIMSDFILLLLMLNGILMNGMPSLIYLTFNRSLRNEYLRLVCQKQKVEPNNAIKAAWK